MADNLILIGLFGLFLGVALRTLAPFVQKWLEGQLNFNEFLARFIGLAAGAYVAGAALYLEIAPLFDDAIREILWTFFLGIAGNEVFNRVYHYYEVIAGRRSKVTA